MVTSTWPGTHPLLDGSSGINNGVATIVPSGGGIAAGKVIVAVANKLRVGVGKGATPGIAGAIKETNTNSTTAIVKSNTNALADWFSRDWALSRSNQKSTLELLPGRINLRR
jgi:hypothetical protein